MKTLAEVLIIIAVISIIMGIIIKLDIIAPLVVLSCKCPFGPLSFLRFANSCLLLAIALFVSQIARAK